MDSGSWSNSCSGPGRILQSVIEPVVADGLRDSVHANGEGGDTLRVAGFPQAGGGGRIWAAPVLALASGALGSTVITCVAYLLAVFGAFCALTSGMAIAEAVIPGHELAGWFLLPLLLLSGTAVHEYGHILGARANGMIPYVVQVGPMQFHAGARGWRMRWRRPERGYAGYVMALCNPCVPLRKQQLTFIAGGPSANLAAAVLLGVPGALYFHHLAGVVLVGLAGLNLAFAAGNLMPRMKGMATDGYLLLSWLLPVEPTDSRWAVEYLNALTVLGTTADALPADVLAQLEGQETQQALPHLWFTLKAHQNQDQWDQAVALEATLESRLGEMPDGLVKPFRNLVDLIRCELGFSSEMAGRRLAHPIDRDLNADLDWIVPWLRPRLQALTAAKAGDSERALSLLARSEVLAADSFDKASLISEGRLRAAVSSMMARQAG